MKEVRVLAGLAVRLEHSLAGERCGGRGWRQLVDGVIHFGKPVNVGVRRIAFQERGHPDRGAAIVDEPAVHSADEEFGVLDDGSRGPPHAAIEIRPQDEGAGRPDRGLGGIKPYLGHLARCGLGHLVWSTLVHLVEIDVRANRAGNARLPRPDLHVTALRDRGVWEPHPKAAHPAAVAEARAVPKL